MDKPGAGKSSGDTRPRHPRRGSLKANPIRVVRRLARPVGYVVLGLAAAMAACGIVGLGMWAFGYYRPEIDEGAALNLLVASLLTTLGGLGLRQWGTPLEGAHLTRRDAIVVTSMVWLFSGAFGALPFMIDAHMSPVDAFFEAISGFTTTGATVVTQIESGLSLPLLLWRSLTQWLGGMGIIVLFVAIFPGLGAGGKHLFRAEVPGPTPDWLRPRITETAFYLWAMYFGLTVAQILSLMVCGVSWFEAICHTFTTLSTGGFSTRDASIAAFESPAVEMVIVVFMLLAGGNFGLYYAALRARRVGVLLRSTEFRAYTGIVVVTFLGITATNIGVHGGSVVQSARYSIFTVATFLTSTGYTTEDYMLSGVPALMLIVLIMFIGGSAGSTAGGIKVSRVVVTLKAMYADIKHQVRPNLVQVVRLGRTPQPTETLVEVLAFVCIFFCCLGASTLAITVLEQTATVGSAFGASLSALSNMGPAPYHVGPDNFAAYGDVSKLIFSFDMVLGRLEFLTLLALGLPEVWRP